MASAWFVDESGTGLVDPSWANDSQSYGELPRLPRHRPGWFGRLVPAYLEETVGAGLSRAIRQDGKVASQE
jgi:hypothetical protein